MKSLILPFLLALTFASCSESGLTGASPSENGSASPPATHLDATGAADLLKNDSSVNVLDVRTPEEFSAGHLAGAINIDYRSDSFAEQVAADLKKNQAYLLHCRSGGRSSAALEILQGLGFTNIYHLDGGMNDWTKAGLPVEK